MSGSLYVLVLSMGGPVVASAGRTMGDVVVERAMSLAASLALASVNGKFGWHVCKDEFKTCVKPSNTHTRVRREKKGKKGGRFRACPVERRQSVDELNPEIHNGTGQRGYFGGYIHRRQTLLLQDALRKQARETRKRAMGLNAREAYLVRSSRFAAVRQAFLVFARLGFIQLISWKRCR